MVFAAIQLLLFQAEASGSLLQAPTAPTETTAEPSQMVGFVAFALLILSLSAVGVVCAYLIIAMRRHANARHAQGRTNGPSPELPDPWEEASRRVELEDDDTIPREPGSA